MPKSTPVGYMTPGRQRPHEILICFAVVFSGVVGLLSPDTVSPSITQAFPGVMSAIYFLALISSGLVSLYGVYGKTMVSPMIERAGLFAMALFLVAYALSLIARNGDIALIAAIMPTAVAIANVVRAFQITRALEQARRDVQ